MDPIVRNAVRTHVQCFKVIQRSINTIDLPLD